MPESIVADYCRLEKVIHGIRMVNVGSESGGLNGNKSGSELKDWFFFWRKNTYIG